MADFSDNSKCFFAINTGIWIIGNTCMTEHHLSHQVENRIVVYDHDTKFHGLRHQLVIFICSALSVIDRIPLSNSTAARLMASRSSLCWMAGSGKCWIRSISPMMRANGALTTCDWSHAIS